MSPSFTFIFSFSSLNLKFSDIYTVIDAPSAKTEQSRTNIFKKSSISSPSFFTISTSACVCACAICGRCFPHQGEWRAEGQRKERRWWQEQQLLFSTAAFHGSPTQTPHPAQVNIYMGGISLRFPLIHTHLDLTWVQAKADGWKKKNVQILLGSHQLPLGPKFGVCVCGGSSGSWSGRGECWSTQTRLWRMLLVFQRLVCVSLRLFFIFVLHVCVCFCCGDACFAVFGAALTATHAAES